MLGRATSAAEGLARAAEPNPDLILMGLATPGMDARKALRRIRRDTDTPTTVIVSLHASAVHRARAGADGFIAKQDFVAKLPPLLEALLRGEGT